MRYILMLSVLVCAVMAEDAPRQLDPAKPADAVQIVAQIAAQVPLKLADSQALLAALQTLATLAAPPAVVAAPVEQPKAKP